MTLRLYYDPRWLASVPWDVASLCELVQLWVTRVWHAGLTGLDWLKSREETHWPAITLVGCLMAFILYDLYSKIVLRDH